MKSWVIAPERVSAPSLLYDQIVRMRGEGGTAPAARVSECRILRENRLYPRTDCFLLVDYVVEGCAYRSFINNISLDGAFIESQRPVPGGPEISLVISFHDEPRPVKIEGRIVRTCRQGIGVRFHPLLDVFRAAGSRP